MKKPFSDFNYKDPLVGLVINYRDHNRTIACVMNIISEGVNKVVVWDNSEDNGESAKFLVSQLQNENIEIYVNPVNCGFSKAVNGGLSLIRKKFGFSRVLLINNDALMQTGALAIMISEMSINSSASIVYPSITEADGSISGPLYYHAVTGLMGLKWLPGSFKYASGCCLLIDSKKFPDTIFDEDFFMYGEDVELGWRFKLHPEFILHASKANIFHEGSASSKKGSFFYEKNVLLSHFILAKKLSSNNFQMRYFFLMRFIFFFFRCFFRSVSNRSLIPAKVFLYCFMKKNNMPSF